VKLSRQATILYGLLLFVSGGVVGAMVQRLYAVSAVSAVAVRPSPDEWRVKYVEEMQTRLHLTPDQLLKLNIYLDETRSLVREAQAKVKPEIEQIKRDQREKIKTMLNDTQRPEYVKMIEERDRREQQQQQQPPTPKMPNGPGF
jgi:hypothetical protein